MFAATDVRVYKEGMGRRILANYLRYFGLFYLLLIGLWLLLAFYNIKYTIFNSLFALVWSFLLILGSVSLLFIFMLLSPSRVQPKLRNFVVFNLLAVLFWGVGNVVWSLYSLFLMVEVPFPSLADIFFVSYYFLAHVSGVKLLTGKDKNRDISKVLVSTVLLVICLGLLIPLLTGTGLSPQIFLGMVYIFFDLFFLSFLFISRFMKPHHMESIVKNWVLVLGNALLLLSDIMFLLTTETGNYFNGCFVDLMFISAFFILILGIVKSMLVGFPEIFSGVRVENPFFVVKLSYYKTFGLNCLLNFELVKNGLTKILIDRFDLMKLNNPYE